jgi:hypothetical protein
VLLLFLVYSLLLYCLTHLGHASAEMTRRYQRKRDRFKVNLTKAAGL